MEAWPFRCKICNLRTMTEKEIKVHILETHLGLRHQSTESKEAPDGFVNTEPTKDKFAQIFACPKKNKFVTELRANSPKGNHVECKGNISLLSNFRPSVWEEKRIKEAESDLFCPFASICSFDTNTTQKLKRHIDDAHPNASVFSCIFPLCNYGTTNSLKQYSTHLRIKHTEEVRNVLKFVRDMKTKTDDFVLVQNLINKYSGYSSIAPNENTHYDNTFIIMPHSNSNELQPLIKTTSKQIVQGAAHNGFLAISPAALSSHRLRGANKPFTEKIESEISKKGTNINSPPGVFAVEPCNNYYLSSNTQHDLPNLNLKSSICFGDTLGMEPLETEEMKLNRKEIDLILEDIEDDIADSKRHSFESSGADRPSLETKANKMLETVINDPGMGGKPPLEITNAESIERSETVSSLQISFSRPLTFSRNKHNQISHSNKNQKQKNTSPVLSSNQCKICAKILGSEVGLSRHITISHKEVRFKCRGCKFYTTSYLKFNRHQKSHSNSIL